MQSKWKFWLPYLDVVGLHDVYSRNRPHPGPEERSMLLVPGGVHLIEIWKKSERPLSEPPQKLTPYSPLTP
jgi:hypothetical protein